jgi:small conductance mechanosensitive channel
MAAWLRDLEAWWKDLNDDALMHLAVSAGLRIVIGAVALYIGFQLAKWIAQLTSKAMTRAKLEPTAALFLRKVVYVILLAVVVLGVLQVVFGVAPTSLVAVVGAAGLAIGLALKDSLSNVASGVMLVSLKPFRVGDIVKIAGESGKVEAVSIFQTQLRGADNQLIVLPNSLITGDSIVNLTPDHMRRIELIIGISYSDSIDTARATVLEIIGTDKRVLADPPADVLVYALAESSVSLGIRCHVRNDDFFATKCELLERIKKAFDAAGIHIPYPQRDIRMYHYPAPDAVSGEK